MTQTAQMFLEDAYQRVAPATVRALTPEGGIVLDQSLFYPTGGGQPGDTGHLIWADETLEITDTRKGDSGAIVLIPAADAPVAALGTPVEQRLDWSRRLGLMRVHTCLHLLSVVIPLPVTGGAISPGKGRLDFSMPEAPQDKAAIQTALQALIDRDLPVTDSWITDAELDANPGLVKTLSVAPPRGAGRVRLVRIGEGADQVDLQPCGGTHVALTGQVGRIRLGKIEKKGRQNRRVYVHLEE